MSENARLEERKQVLEKEYKKLGEELIELNEQGKILNQKMSERRTKQVELTGAYKEINDLLGLKAVAPMGEEIRKARKAKGGK